MVALTAAHQMVILFIGIVLGYVAIKAKIIKADGTKAITALVLNIIMPMFIVNAGLSGNQSTSGTTMFFYFCLSLVCYAVAYFLGFLLARTKLIPDGDKRLCSFMTTFSNNGFMGLPIVGALFGSDAVLYATIFNLPFNFLVFSIGVYLVSDDAKFKHIDPKKFINPCLIASIIAILCYVFGLKAPTIVSDCLSLFGSATVPLAMIITGASLARETPRSIFMDPALYAISFVKLAIVPTFAFFLLKVAIGDPILVQVGTVLMAMPVAANATMLCVQYGGDDRFASRGIFLSTLLSLATVPVAVMLMA